MYEQNWGSVEAGAETQAVGSGGGGVLGLSLACENPGAHFVRNLHAIVLAV